MLRPALALPALPRTTCRCPPATPAPLPPPLGIGVLLRPRPASREALSDLIQPSERDLKSAASCITKEREIGKRGAKRVFVSIG